MSEIDSIPLDPIGVRRRRLPNVNGASRDVRTLMRRKMTRLSVNIEPMENDGEESRSVVSIVLIKPGGASDVYPP